MIDDENKEEFFENGGQVKVSINDKRRFNDHGFVKVRHTIKFVFDIIGERV